MYGNRPNATEATLANVKSSALLKVWPFDEMLKPPGPPTTGPPLLGVYMQVPCVSLMMVRLLTKPPRALQLVPPAGVHRQTAVALLLWLLFSRRRWALSARACWPWSCSKR